MSGVQSIERAFSLLRALALGPAGVTELAERAELPKSTVARLLGALETEGAVEQLEVGGQYRLGTGLADLAGAAAPGRNLITAARPHLLELSRATGETCGISVLDGDTVLYLDHVETEEEVQVRSWTGERVPPHLVASGLVLLAAAPSELTERYLARPLEATTSRSMTDPDQLRARLADVASSGHAWVYAEFDDGINGVAVAVRDRSGQAVAALHIHGPAYRFPGERGGDEVARQVERAAAQLSGHLT